MQTYKELKDTPIRLQYPPMKWRNKIIIADFFSLYIAENKKWVQIYKSKSKALSKAFHVLIDQTTGIVYTFKPNHNLFYRIDWNKKTEQKFMFKGGKLGFPVLHVNNGILHTVKNVGYVSQYNLNTHQITKGARIIRKEVTGRSMAPHFSAYLPISKSYVTFSTYVVDQCWHVACTVDIHKQGTTYPLLRNSVDLLFNCAASYVIDPYERYVVSLGGCIPPDDIHHGRWERTDIINILDFKRNLWGKCTITLPRKLPVQAVIKEKVSRFQQQLLCFGYVRDSWKKKVFANMRYLPKYLIDLIFVRVQFVEIHLFSTVSNYSIWQIGCHCKFGKHWVISLDALIQSIKHSCCPDSPNKIIACKYCAKTGHICDRCCEGFGFWCRICNQYVCDDCVDENVSTIFCEEYECPDCKRKERKTIEKRKEVTGLDE